MTDTDYKSRAERAEAALTASQAQVRALVEAIEQMFDEDANRSIVESKGTVPSTIIRAECEIRKRHFRASLPTQAHAENVRTADKTHEP